MKSLKFPLVVALVALSACSSTPQLTSDAPLVYVNQNFGFTVPGYKYDQSEIPCEIEPKLVKSLIESAALKNIRLEAVSTPDKINNNQGIPVLAIDINGLVLASKAKQIGTKSASELPRIKITSALFDNRSAGSFKSENHGCSILQLNQLTPSSNILDLGTVSTVCSATEKCIKDLGKDVVDWMVPLVSKK